MNICLAFIALILTSVPVFAAETDDLTLSEWSRHVEDMSPQNQASMARFVATLNKGLPKMIDSATRLDEVVVNKNGLGYNMTVMIDLGMSGQEIIRATRDVLAQTMCRNPEKIGWLTKGFMFTHMYFDKMGKYIGTIVIAKSDCATVGGG